MRTVSSLWHLGQTFAFNIYIGNESNLDEDVTIIKTKYKTDDDEGTIAIIGPKRMEYSKVVALLGYIKDNLNKK